MTLALGGQRRGKEEAQPWAGGGEPFVFSQVQLLGLNRWHPIGGPRSGTRCSRWLRAGAGSFADACHSLPRQKQEEGVHRCYLHRGSHLGCYRECPGDIPGRWGDKKGLPDVGRDKPPLMPTGATVFWHLLCTEPQAGALHARSLMSSTTLQEKPHLADEKLRLHGPVPCPDRASQLTGGRAQTQAQVCPILKKPTFLPSDPTQKWQRESAGNYPLKTEGAPLSPGSSPLTSSELSALLVHPGHREVCLCSHLRLLPRPGSGLGEGLLGAREGQLSKTKANLSSPG